MSHAQDLGISLKGLKHKTSAPFYFRTWLCYQLYLLYINSRHENYFITQGTSSIADDAEKLNL